MRYENACRLIAAPGSIIHEFDAPCARSREDHVAAFAAQTPTDDRRPTACTSARASLSLGLLLLSRP